MIFILMGSFFTSSDVAGQELFALGGLVSSSGNNAIDWQISYEESISEHFAYSVSWLNEGHLTHHHRDGPICQLWGRTSLLDDSLTLSAGVGPYLFFDTQKSAGTQYKGIHRSWGGIGSLAGTWRIEGGWLVQLRGNYVLAESNINTASILFGIGYEFQTSAPRRSNNSAIADSIDDVYQEIAILLGGTTINASKESQTSMAASFDYRRGIFSFLDWTVGWLHEGDMEFLRRSGLTTQLWPTKSLLNGRLRIGLGLGAYVPINSRCLSETGEEEYERLLGLITPTISYRFTGDWVARFSWNRTVSSCNRDSDVLLGGIGYRF